MKYTNERDKLQIDKKEGRIETGVNKEKNKELKNLLREIKSEQNPSFYNSTKPSFSNTEFDHNIKNKELFSFKEELTSLQSNIDKLERKLCI
jgi:hypothetical protein